MAKSLKYSEVVKLLNGRDKQFKIYVKRGKGSHRMIFHPDIDGSKASCPIPFHKGSDISKKVLKAIIKKFKLPKNFFN